MEGSVEWESLSGRVLEKKMSFKVALQILYVWSRLLPLGVGSALRRVLSYNKKETQSWTSVDDRSTEWVAILKSL